jgi:beta-lactamase regulating signal transducer with metallopeptidase domain
MMTWITITGWTLVHFVWQGAVIAAGAAIGFRALRDATPQERYSVASAALALMLIVPSVTAWYLAPSTGTRTGSVAVSVVLPVPDPGTSVGDRLRPVAATATRLGPHVRRQFEAMLPAIVLSWLLGVGLLLVRLLGGWWRVRALHQSSLAAPTSIWGLVAEGLAVRLGLRHRVRVVDSQDVDTPTLIGWWRPVILLPIAGLAGLTPSQVEAILLHELAHIRRYDYLVNLLQRVTETVLFYHPAVWWVSRRLRFERELCCDAVVVALGQNATDYAYALAHLEQRRSGPPVLAVAASGGALLERIRALLDPRPRAPRPMADAWLTSTVVLALVLLLGGGSRSLQALRTMTRFAQNSSGADAVITTTNRKSITEAVTLTDGQPPPNTVPRAPAWQTSTTAHFDLSLTPDVEAQRDRVAREADRVYQRISTDLGYALEVRPTLMGFATRAAWANGVAAGSITRSATAQPRVLIALDGSDDQLRSNLTHEITHLFEFSILSSKVLPQTPLWIVEGLSEYEAGTWAAGDQDLLRALARTNPGLRITTFDTLTDTANPRLPYAVGHAAVDFLVARWQIDGIRRWLAVLRSGTVDPEQLYPRAFGVTSADIDRDFAWYLADRFQTAAVQQTPHEEPVTGPTRRPATIATQGQDANMPSICGQAVPPTNFLPPPTSEPVIYLIAPCFDRQGGKPHLSDPVTYLEDIHLRPSRPSQGEWTAYDATAEHAIEEDVQRLRSHHRLDVSIEVRDYAFSNGVIGKLVIYHLTELVNDRASAATSPELPHCLQDAGLISFDLKDVTIPQVLKFLASACGVEVRVEGIEGTEAARTVPRVQFSNTKLSEVFQFLVTAAGLSYAVVDETTLLITRP